MHDEPDPPRKVYGFKPREFVRSDVPRPDAPADSVAPASAPGIPVADPGKIDVNELIRAGAGAGRQLGSNSVVNRANEVHDILRDNFQRDIAAGRYELGVLDDSKRRRRIRNYWIGLAIVDLPLGGFAYWIGHEAAIPFVCAIAVVAMFTSYLTWQTFFLRTHY